jgi:hypothetical protein
MRSSGSIRTGVETRGSPFSHSGLSVHGSPHDVVYSCAGLCEDQGDDVGEKMRWDGGEGYPGVVCWGRVLGRVVMEWSACA